MFKSFVLGAAALLLTATPLLAQGATGATASSPAPETRRAPISEELDNADRPTSPIKVVIPAGFGTLAGGTSMPGEELNADRVPEELPNEPPQEPHYGPTFFGEPVHGKFVWCLDRSGSMVAHDPMAGPVEDRYGNTIAQPTRWQRVRAEVITVLDQLSPDDEFAIVSFGH